jgi:hypothetical protein
LNNAGTDSKGRNNPCAWRAWAYGGNAPEEVRDALVRSFSSKKTRSSGRGAKARRALKRAAAALDAAAARNADHSCDGYTCSKCLTEHSAAIDWIQAQASTGELGILRGPQ